MIKQFHIETFSKIYLKHINLIIILFYHIIFLKWSILIFVFWLHVRHELLLKIKNPLEIGKQ